MMSTSLALPSHPDGAVSGRPASARSDTRIPVASDVPRSSHEPSGPPGRTSAASTRRSSQPADLGSAPRVPRSSGEELRQLANLSDVPARRGLKTPASPQYMYTKGLRPEQRIALTNDLIDVMRGSTWLEGVSSQRAAQMFTVVQRARLRAHRAADRQMAGRASLLSAIRSVQDPSTHDRDLSRLEHQAASRLYEEMLADDQIGEQARRVIFDGLIGQLRQKLFDQDHADTLLDVLTGEPPTRGRARSVPKSISEEMYQTMLEYARVTGQIQLVRPARRIDGDEPRSFEAVKSISASHAGFEPGVTLCMIMHTPLEYDDHPMVFYDKANPAERTFYGEAALRTWASTGAEGTYFDAAKPARHPVDGRIPLTAENYAIYVHRINPDEVDASKGVIDARGGLLGEPGSA